MQTVVAALLLAGWAYAAPAPAVRTRTYFISGVRDDADVAAITAAVRSLPSVTEINGLTAKGGSVSVRFDTHVISHGQVAYAIMGAHAKPDRYYTVTMRFGVPEYATSGNAEKIDEIMARQSSLADIRLTNREKGIFEARILPYPVDPHVTKPQGFHGGSVFHPVIDPKPKGLGMRFDYLGPGNKPDPME